MGGWYPDPAADSFLSAVLLPVTALRYVKVAFSPLVLQRSTSGVPGTRCTMYNVFARTAVVIHIDISPPDVRVRLGVTQAVHEPCTVKMTSLEESNQYSSAARRYKIRSWDARVVTMQIA